LFYPDLTDVIFMASKKTVLASVGKMNFPEDVAESIRSLAKVVYATQEDYKSILSSAVAVIVGTEKIDETYLDIAPNLMLISRFGVGYDSVDVEACTDREIYVTHTPRVLSEAVAEHTWALILGFTRMISSADCFIREEWALRKRRFPFGTDLIGKTFGIIGLGAIGTEVAKRSQGFGLKLIYHDVVRKPELEQKLRMEFVELNTLLQESDIVSLHAPLLPSTRRLIGVKELQMMKSTAFIVNTSRGPVIDQRALTEALKDGKIAGAALDVFEEEPIPLDEELLEMENVLATPHIASATWETRRKMAMSCAESVREFLKGKRPRNLVPEQKNVSF
jgi:glyoxylate reductase